MCECSSLPAAWIASEASGQANDAISPAAKTRNTRTRRGRRESLVDVPATEAARAPFIDVPDFSFSGAITHFTVVYTPIRSEFSAFRPILSNRSQAFAKLFQ